MERGETRTPRKGRKKDEDENKVFMPHHSFHVPLVYQDVLKDWQASGASVVESQRLLLHPSIAERLGYFWSTQPLLTNDFEATVSFRVTGPKEVLNVATDQSFALWYVYENVSAGYNETQLIKASSWADGLLESSMGLSGSKSKFQGFGAVFSTTDSKKTPKAVVSGIWNDGDRDFTSGVGKDVPTADAKAIDFRNTMNAAQFRLRVTPTSIIGYLKQTPSLSWNECFNLDRKHDPVKTGGYIGFSAWSGTKSPSAASDMVAITQFDVYNFDSTTIGESMMGDVSKEIEDTYRQMLTDENRHFTDQKLQTEHINRLIRMINQHVSDSKPLDEKIFQDIEVLSNRVGQLDEGCRTLTKELELVSEISRGDQPSIKDDIIGLRRLLSKGEATQKRSLDLVEKNLAEVRQRHQDTTKTDKISKMAAEAEVMQSTVESHSQRMVWLMLILIPVFIAVGWGMYSRMQEVSRKNSGLVY